MDIKGVLGGLLLIVVAFLVAIFLVPLVAGNDSKEFKVLMGIIIVGDLAEKAQKRQKWAWSKIKRSGHCGPPATAVAFFVYI